ncbi:MAG: glycosyltransferase [Planctomycetes bacterium]|nr:glycosyltransferase [Planctomycetota bacterium]
MMRVLISASTFPIKRDDGTPRFVYDLAEALSRRCEVTVLAPDAPGAARQEWMAGMDVRRFTYFRPRRWQSLAYGHGMRDNLRGSFRCKLQPLPFVWAQSRATRSLVRQKGIQVVNSHWMIPQGLTAAWARGPAKRFHHVLSVHAADVYMLQKLSFGPALARFIHKRTDFVFADGSHVRDSLDRLLGYPSEAVLQPNGVQIDLFGGNGNVRPIETPFRDGHLLFFGRFSEKKGVTYLLRAMPKILERHPGIGLVLIGYGALEGELRSEVSRLAIGQSVKFVGRQPHTEIVRYLRGCRAAMVPSIIDRYGETEGMPTVVLEAMAAGTKVIGSAVDGIPDVIRHRENGWLCRQKDPDDLAEKILDALADPPTSGIIQNAVDTAARFDWPKVAARYVEVFERLAGQSGAAAHEASVMSH